MSSNYKWWYIINLLSFIIFILKVILIIIFLLIDNVKYLQY